jgi:hypothetical protein
MIGERGADVVSVHVIPGVGDDAEHVDELTSLLREELLELDIEKVEPLREDAAPPGSKGVGAAVGGWLAVHFGPAGLRAVVNAIAAWTARTGKTVELSIGGNTLKLTGLSADVQSKIVEEFFARQASPT